MSQFIYFLINKSDIYYHKDENGNTTNIKVLTGTLPDIGLPDLATYNIDGTVQEASFELYANNFLKRVNELETNLEIENHFELHLSNHIISGGNYEEYFNLIEEKIKNDTDGILSSIRANQLLSMIHNRSKNFKKQIFYEVKKGKLDNRYQCELKEIQGNFGWSYKKHVDEAFKSSLNAIAYKSLGYVEEFLQYHYDFYSFSKEDWLRNTEQLIKEIKGHNSVKFIEEIVVPRADEWIKKKREDIGSDSDENIKAPLTERQQSLFFYYIDRKYKVNKMQERKPYALVTAKILNKKTTNFDNANYYKHILYPLKHDDTPGSKKSLIKNLKIIRGLFFDLGNYEIVAMIDVDIKSIDET